MLFVELPTAVRPTGHAGQQSATDQLQTVRVQRNDVIGEKRELDLATRALLPVDQSGLQAVLERKEPRIVAVPDERQSKQIRQFGRIWRIWSLMSR